jgi:two-component system phosphate regulon sensor histidine kinase PhoR
VLLVSLVIVPTSLLLIIGILMLVLWRMQLNVLFGILVVTLVGLMVTGTVLSLVLLSREARLSMLQLDFVSKVSHELRTPLTSVRLFAETLQLERTRDTEQVELCLDVLDKETARLSERIERLLSWGSMEAGRRVFAAEPVRLDEVVRDALDLFEPAVAGTAGLVKVEVEGTPPSVRGDRVALADAVLNLLTNAFKYGGHIPGDGLDGGGAGAERVDTVPLADPEAAGRPSGLEPQIRVIISAEGREARLAVIDRGIGIPRGVQKRIFEKFFRVDERLSRRVEGSGLGLAIVRHVVRAHGGRVDLESEPGQGSTFTIVLPLDRSGAREGSWRDLRALVGGRSTIRREGSSTEDPEGAA